MGIGNKISWKSVLFLALQLAAGLALGGFLGSRMGSLGLEGPAKLLALGALILGLTLGSWLQIILHEGGHLVFGLLTGYGFSSFRIGSHMWLRTGTGMVHKRLSLAGTGGQCLLTPPPLKEGKMPYVWYNLGGVLANLICSALFWGLAALLPRGNFLGIFLEITALLGLVFALINGIPLHTATVDNDGYNALSLGSHPAALRAFWLQLRVNEEQAKGLRLRDMPEDWFALPDRGDWANSMVAAVAVLRENRLMDEGREEEADALIRELLAGETGLVGLHRSLLICDRITLECLGDCRDEELARLYSREQQRFMKQMKRFPTVLRTVYARQLLWQDDREQAAQTKAAFERMAEGYPYDGDIASERDWLARIDARAAEKAEN